MDVESGSGGQNISYIRTQRYTHIQSLRAAQKLFNRYTSGFEIPPPHNGKRNPYQVLQGVVTLPPQNLKKTRTMEARQNNNKGTSKCKKNR